MVRNGRVDNLSHVDKSTEGVRALLKMVSEDKEVDATTIATVGEKGYDGFMYAVRL
jgi:hypothetical protein